MAQIRPFSAVRFTEAQDISALIAPPYDVLSGADRQELLRRHPHNIVNIDLPHYPAKEAGPEDVYEQAAITYQAWRKAGVLAQDVRPALYPYAQTYEHAGMKYHRRGFFALVKLSPFGAGQVYPHEKTYKGPIEDRLKLMRATGLQLSPIFGLYSDPKNQVTGALYRNVGRAELTAELDHVRHDLWAVPEAEIENEVIDLMGTRPIYIADGHHRYTTALQYKLEMEQKNGGPLPASHPANWCLFVLVGMEDPGLLILPTHRMLGGLSGFDAAAFAQAIAPEFEMAEAPYSADQLGAFMDEYLPRFAHTFGLFDGVTRKVYLLRARHPDILAKLEPGQSAEWRRLDVAVLERFLIDEAIKPRFVKGELVKSYTADPAAIAPQVDGQRHQVALLLQPTPLLALEELARHGEVMPQKSTFFYPKLATGMVINPLA